MKNIYVLITACVLINSCTTKKDIVYLQNADEFNNSEIITTSTLIQPNDVLQIKISAAGVPEITEPYNIDQENISSTPQMMALSGYLVPQEEVIEIPQLGKISTKNESIFSLQQKIKERLIEEGHLKEPIVSVRLVNAKFTVLGSVNGPGTYNFYESNITIFQALGYAGDLTIRGVRDDVIVIRETENNRTVAHLDLTSAELYNSPYFLIKPNDFIYVRPNGPEIKSAGYISNIGALLSVFSILLSTTLILTR